MSHIKLMKLAGLLTETTKKKLKEATTPYQIVGKIDNWFHRDIGNPKNFDISLHWRAIGMSKRPDNLSEEEVQGALEDCDRNINRAQTLLDMANKAKEQIESLVDSAATISAGEKEYENINITPQNVLDFLKSILVDDKDNAKEIYGMYNAFINNKYKNADDLQELLLSSPSDLIGRGRVRGKDDVIFEYKRQSGGLISENALYESVLKFVGKNYPEVKDLLLIRTGASFKKYFTIRVKRSAMASGAAINRSWRRIFIKYAEWVDA